jgi:gliding motility-associated-like protein
MKMKISKLLILVILLIGSLAAEASHVVGYDMNLVSLGNGNYRFRMKGYRDISGIDLAGSFNFGIYRNSDNGLVTNITLTRISKVGIVYDPKDCPPPGADLKIELQTYESPIINMSTYNSAQGYYISYDDCCRNGGVTNIVNSSSVGAVYNMEFPRLNTGSSTAGNNSPEWRKAPLAFFCVGKPYTLDWNVVDPDGDSLAFSLETPYAGSNTKPFDLVTFAPGYNVNYNIMDGVPDLTINPRTGVINFIPTKVGRYVVSFLCKEFRNGVKIGEVRREFQVETVLCPEAPPVTEDNNNQKRVIVDTIDFDQDFSLTFTSRDSPTDSLFMYILPNIAPNENLLDPNTYNAKWGEVGFPVGGSTAENLVIEKQGTVVGQFIWRPKCAHVREDKPYKFTVVVRDKTCPSPFYDSTFVSLYVRKKPNIRPYFVLPDTIKTTSPSNKKLRRYFVNAGDKFQLASDSIIRTYDQDSSQVVNIIMVPDPTNGAVNGEFVFSANPVVVNSTASFLWQTSCDDKRDQPYYVDFVAFDNDCLKPDSVRFTIEIYIKDQPNKPALFADTTINEFRVQEGMTRSFSVVSVDTINTFNNYRFVSIYPDLSDFLAVTGGVMPICDTVASANSVTFNFTWSPNCANVRIEPYRLRLKTSDEGCPVQESTAEILIYADGPFNSAPEFRTANNTTITTIDTSIYAGEIFNFNIFAVDTNTRFDSVYISLDMTSEVADPNLVEYPATLASVDGKDSARTSFTWRTDCFDIRSTPYAARIIARDNECVNPEVQVLTFNITVLERPNYVPTFTASTLAGFNPGNAYDMLATDTLLIPLSAFDTLTNEVIIIDTAFTNIPFNLPKPEIVRATGLGKDTVSTQLMWILDCSLIRNEPYTIRIAAFDEACRNPQDSSTYQFTVKVSRNPLLNPVLNISADTIIQLVAGEKFTLDLFSISPRPSDSIFIVSNGSVYGGIPGNLATFEQTQMTAPAQAQFKWETSCDQISDSVYIAYFRSYNPPCLTDTSAFRISFKVIPNTDITNKIPNVFTPNGDGVNDIYSINKQYKVYCDPKFKFTIFNRWGKKVFESIDPDFQWEPDQSQGAGTYFYTLESRAKTETGTIDIIK